LQGISRGDELDALHPAELLPVLQREASRGQSSLIVITGASTQGDLQSEPRLQTQKVASQDGLVALRVGLKASGAVRVSQARPPSTCGSAETRTALGFSNGSDSEFNQRSAPISRTAMLPST